MQPCSSLPIFSRNTGSSVEVVCVQGKALARVQQEQDCISLVPRFSGRLDGLYMQGANDIDSMWVDPAQPLAVTVRSTQPYVEWQQRCIWTPFWKQEPLLFFVLPRTRVSLTVLSTFMHEPLPDVELQIDLHNLPRPPPPQPLAWEMAEGPSAYAHRLLVRKSMFSCNTRQVLSCLQIHRASGSGVSQECMSGRQCDSCERTSCHISDAAMKARKYRCASCVQSQLVDYVVESGEDSTIASIAEHALHRSDAVGKAELLLPAGATVDLQATVSASDAAAAGAVLGSLTSSHAFTVAFAREQALDLAVPQVAILKVVIRELGKGVPVRGAAVRCTIIEDEQGVSLDGAAAELSPSPFETDASGATAWFQGRAGMLVRVDLAAVPFEYLDMTDLDRVLEQERVVRLAGAHTIEWVIPHKPQIQLRCHDVASGERVVGVQYRVMARPHAARTARPRVSFGGALV